MNEERKEKPVNEVKKKIRKKRKGKKRRVKVKQRRNE